MKKIESRQNPLFKKWLKLLDRKGRKEFGEFIVEGISEIGKALASEYELTAFSFTSEYLADAGLALQKQMHEKYQALCVELSANCFDQLAVRQKTGGVLAVFRCKEHSFNPEPLPLDSVPIFLVIENGEKPGNLGALLRTASASGVSAVFVLGAGVDLYNPHVIRASLGALFLLQIIICNKTQLLDYCRYNGVQLFLASLRDRSKPYWQNDYKKACAFVLGSEAHGLEMDWYSQNLPLVYIPMEGSLDSLNLSVSGALLLYEAKRQRQEKKGN